MFEPVKLTRAFFSGVIVRALAPQKKSHNTRSEPIFRRKAKFSRRPALSPFPRFATEDHTQVSQVKNLL